MKQPTRSIVNALEIVPRETGYEFARGARVAVMVRVGFHDDPDTVLPDWGEAASKTGAGSKLPTPTESFADQPDETVFWGLRVESVHGQTERYPASQRYMTTTVEVPADGKPEPSTPRPAPAKYRVFDLSPSSHYQRAIDLGRLSDFSQPGEYRVQILYDSGGNAEGDERVWDGSLTSPVFTVVIKK